MIESIDVECCHINRIYIVDNNSDYGEIEILKRYLRSLCIRKRNKIDLLINKKNLGYFGGLNVALKEIRCSNEFIIICNNDVVFDKSFFLKLSGRVFSEKVFVVAPDIVTIEGYHQNPHVIKPFSKFKKLTFDIYFSNYYLGKTVLSLKRLFFRKRGRFIPYPLEIQMGKGACYILTENFFRFFDLLDARTFLFGEEALLSHQVRSQGGKILYDPEYRVEHLEKVATSEIPSKAQYEISERSYRVYRAYL
jgi:GT2 family glycosyltransferase